MIRKGCEDSGQQSVQKIPLNHRKEFEVYIKAIGDYWKILIRGVPWSDLQLTLYYLSGEAWWLAGVQILKEDLAKSWNKEMAGG